MRLQLNRFLLMLMMLALPVQTFASAAMLDCAFSHQGSAAHQGLVMAADEMTAACHESKLPDNSPISHNCKHCAACYLASALAIPYAAAASIAPVSHSVIPYAVASFIGFIPDSPERPPRTSFA